MLECLLVLLRNQKDDDGVINELLAIGTLHIYLRIDGPDIV